MTTAKYERAINISTEEVIGVWIKLELDMRKSMQEKDTLWMSPNHKVSIRYYSLRC